MGNYLIQFWGDFVDNEPIVETGDARYLAFGVDEIRDTIVTLTINAADITYVVNR